MWVCTTDRHTHDSRREGEEGRKGGNEDAEDGERRGWSAVGVSQQRGYTRQHLGFCLSWRSEQSIRPHYWGRRMRNGESVWSGGILRLAPKNNRIPLALSLCCASLLVSLVLFVLFVLFFDCLIRMMLLTESRSSERTYSRQYSSMSRWLLLKPESVCLFF